MKSKKNYCGLFCLVFLLLISNFTLAQQNKLKQAETYLAKARNFNSQGIIDTALINYIRAKEQYEEINIDNKYKKQLRNTCTEIGLLFDKAEVYDKAEAYFSEALNYTENNDKENRIKLLSHIVEVYFSKGGKLIAKAIEKLKEILLLETAKNSNQDKIQTRYKLAYAHEELAKENLKKLSPEKIKSDTTTLYHYREALQYKRKILELSQSDAAKAQAYNNIAYTKRKIANLQTQQEEEERAIKTLKESLEDIKKAEKLHQNEESEESKLISWLNMGIIQQNKGNYAEAIEYFNKVRKRRDETNNYLELGRTDNLLAKTRYYQKKYATAKIDAEKAVNAAKKAIEEGETKGNTSIISDSRKSLEASYKILVDIHGKFSNYKKLSEYKDSLYLIKEQTNRDITTQKQKQDKLKNAQSVEEKTILKESREQSEKERLASEKKRLEEEKKRLEAEANSQKAEADRQKAEADRRMAEAKNAELAKQKAEADRQRAISEKTAAEAQARAKEEELKATKLKAKADSIAKQKAEADKQAALAAKKIAESKRKAAEQQAETQRSYFILAGIIVFFLLITGFILFFLRRNHKKNKELQAKNDEIEQQNVALAQQKEELLALNDKVSMSNKEVELANFELGLINDEIEAEKHKSENLLLNILPVVTAQELKEKGKATPQSYEMVSVLFTDFKGFTQASAKLNPEDVIKKLEHCFLAFDEIIDKYNLEKIKTIGDAYMCAGGIPIANKTNPIDAVRAGLEIQDFMEKMKQEKIAQNVPYFECRLGIHTGAIVAGVIGKKKFAYDIWGDAVNLASRMESSGEVGKVNISGFTYKLVKDYFEFEYRGKIPAKNKGEVDMYFVLGEKKAHN